MSCPWIENRKQKNQEKTTKYATLRWELKQQHRGYTIKQYNIIIDVLGGYSSETRENVILLLGKTKADKTVFNMQKAVTSSTLNITRSFKLCEQRNSVLLVVHYFMSGVKLIAVFAWFCIQELLLPRLLKAR